MSDIVCLSDTTLPRHPTAAIEAATTQYADYQTTPGAFPPAGQGFKAWTTDPAQVGGGNTFATGGIYWRRWKLGVAASIASMCVHVDTAPTSQTGGGMAIYSDAGALLVSKSETTLFNSVGLKTSTFASPIALQPGYYWGAFFFIGTAGSGALSAAAAGLSGPVVNPGNLRAVASTGFAAFPSTATYGSYTVSTSVTFMGFL